jgi:hypothetical protein
MCRPARIVDIARFAADDPPEVIRVSLSCSWCLKTATSLTLSEDERDVSALWICDDCGLETVFVLSWSQVAALAGDLTYWPDEEP